MRNFAADMMSDMGLRDAVCGECAKPAHEGTAVTHEAAVEGGESSTGESELWCAVMREEGISVL
jgi:hypothetical protein